jgi:hypothetical protein
VTSLAGQLVVVAVLALIPARIAANKGRSFRLWWLYGWMFLIIALPHALLLRPRLIAIVPAVDDQPYRPLMAACPGCQQQIRANTPKCVFCGALLPV